MIIHDLMETNSKIEKLAILKDISARAKKVFYYAYNPYKRYYIANLTVDINNLGYPSDEMFLLLDKLADRTLVGAAAREAVHIFAQSNGDIIKLIVNKDMDCGVGATILNTAFGKTFIPTFKVQLAKEVPLDKLKYPQIAQLKYDGVRLVMIFKDGVATLRTRNGKLISIPGLTNIIEGYPDLPEVVLDGEITLKSGKMEDRTTISGMVNSARQGGNIDHTEVVFNVFDCLTLNEFESRTCSTKYEQRYNRLFNMVTRFKTPCIAAADWVEVHSAEEADKHYNEVTAEGYEGLILKPKDHLYTYKRSADWVKIKAVKTADIKVVGTEEGTGKYKGMIGAIKCMGIVEEKLISVNVGSGLSDNDRVNAYPLGTILEIKYNAVIPNAADNGHTLFLPRFVCVRTDK